MKMFYCNEYATKEKRGIKAKKHPARDAFL